MACGAMPWGTEALEAWRVRQDPPPRPHQGDRVTLNSGQDETTHGITSLLGVSGEKVLICWSFGFQLPKPTR